jgi:hypothetical protein
MCGMYRKLRIAFSALCGIACLLLIVMWARSYWRTDYLVWGITAKQGFLARSLNGAAVLDYMNFSGSGKNLVLYKWHVESMPLPDTNRFSSGGVDNTFAGFLIQRSGSGGRFLVCVPYWFLVPLTATLAVALSGKWALHFSLKTLLIATTLVAVLLGTIAYAVK